MGVASIFKRAWAWFKDLFRAEEEITKENILGELKEIIERKDPKDGVGGKGGGRFM